MKKLKNWRLKSKEERRFKQGHPWVYSNELQDSPKGIEPGELVELSDSGGAFLAYGFGNPSSLIAFRTLSRTKTEGEVLTDTFFAEAFGRALRFRLDWFKPEQSFRLIFGEVDGLPGLVIDRFAEASSKRTVYVVQPHSAGMDRHLALILGGLRAMAKKLGESEQSLVVLRRDAGSREREGLSKEPTVVQNLYSGATIEDQSLRAFTFVAPGVRGTEIALKADLIAGQKTGFFFDQLQNIRVTETLLMRKLRPDQPGKTYKVLDLCSYIGQWSVHLAQTFALKECLPLEVTCVDASESALGLANENVLAQAKAEGKSDQIRMKRVKADVLEPMPMLPSKEYDVVIADPPAFIENRKSIPQGKAAYVNLFATAIDRTAQGGLVVCCSCSQLLSNEEMIESLAKASRKAGRTVRWIAQGSPSVDHPTLFEFRESLYLKCWIGQVE